VALLVVAQLLVANSFTAHVGLVKVRTDGCDPCQIRVNLPLRPIVRV
jgi:hypothetical protein